MKIGKYEVTPGNIRAFIQGNARLLLEDFGPDVLKSPPHIQEQILWRRAISDKECNELGECTACHCKMPDKLYADKACEGSCYPEIMDKVIWGKFKQLASRREINIFDDKFDWATIIADVDGLEEASFSSLFGLNPTAVSLGQFPEGTQIKGNFKIFNPHPETLILNTVSPSCPCTTIKFPKNIPENEYGIFEYTIDTKGKKVASHDIYLLIRYDEIKRINYALSFDVI